MNLFSLSGADPDTRVVNLRREECDVRIDRPSKWGNPFRITKYVSREKAIEMYESYIHSRPDLMGSLEELRGKRLGCWCKPRPCHGDKNTTRESI